MKDYIVKRNLAASGVALTAAKPSPFLQLVSARAQHRQPRIVLPPSKRRSLCPMRQPLLAALHAAEQAAWQATGGDYLSHSRQPLN